MAEQKLVQAKTPSVSSSGHARLLQRTCACGGSAGVAGECESCRRKKLAGLQTKLAVNRPGDIYEQEADRLADQVMRMSDAGARQPAVTSTRGPAISRYSGRENGGADAPPIVHDVVNSSGQPLDAGTRAFMESRLGHDFGQVRVHTDSRAAESARAVDALAYTVGSDVVFGAGQYNPGGTTGQRLLAHELVHVVQQNHIPHMVSRADTDAVGYVMRIGLVAHTGVQFWPTNVTDTRVGPVSVRGGLLSEGASRLNAIIGENLTLRVLARQLLPLWTTATPFTPDGAAAPLPLDIITADELAQALLVYNQTYLPVPAMTNWRSGLRFPLPVEIEEHTGIATLHPLQIRALATGFDPAWEPLLDQPASATTAPPAETIRTDVAAFLAQETTPLARGIHLGARIVTNAVAALPFVQEVFRQLGASSFEVGLAIMDGLVNNQMSLIASQQPGAAIIREIDTVIAAAPAILTDVQERSLDRASLMIAIVWNQPASATPAAARTNAERTITVDTVRLHGSRHNPATAVAMADSILSQCNVHVTHGANATATEAQTNLWLRGDTVLRSNNSCRNPSLEERGLVPGATAAFGLNARFRAFFVEDLVGLSARGYSCMPSTSPNAVMRNTIIVANSGDTGTLSHELGHILMDSAGHPGNTIMSAIPVLPARRMPRFDNTQCGRLYRHA